MNVTDRYIAENYNLKNDEEYTIEWTDPIDLLNAGRLDLTAKWIYIDGKEKGYMHGREVYDEHIRVITKNSYIEAGYTQKCGIEKFHAVFDKLIDEIKEDGFDENAMPVPVDQNGVILDGAHRTAACLYYGRKIKIVKLPVSINTKYDYRYFLSNRLSENYLDEIVLKYIELSKNVYISNIWPAAVGKSDEIEQIISNYGKIFYKKNIRLNVQGGINYIRQVYSRETWIGTAENGFEGCYRKLMPCFENRDIIRLYFFETERKEEILKLKERIRSLYHAGKHSVHINDTQKEAVEMSRLLLNRNSIEFLNHSNMCVYPKSYEKLLRFKNDSYMQDMAVTGSVVMSLYGLREANDIDYITASKRDRYSHNKMKRYYVKPGIEMMNNPQYFFYTDGMKVLTLKTVYQFKKCRDEKKDREDAAVIIDFLQKRKTNKLVKAKRYFIQKKRMLIAMIQGIILKTAHKTNTYTILKRIYHKVKRYDQGAEYSWKRTDWRSRNNGIKFPEEFHR